MSAAYRLRSVLVVIATSSLAALTGSAASAAEENAKAAVQPAMTAATELPVRKIPNIPDAAEAYYAPDSLHVIAQTQDPAASHIEGRASGALTYTFTDIGTEITRINDHGQDACSYFLPDGKHVIWTSTRDHPEMPMGNWSDDNNYPQGAELYISDLDGKNIRRLTNNQYYEAEVTVSPDGKWIFFGRQINGNMDIWRMKIDGTGEQQLTFTSDWQEGAPYPMPDNKHLIFRAWKKSEKAKLDEERKATGKRSQTPMTIFTMNYDGTNVQPRTFTKDMNWAPYPAPDGRHFVYVRVFEGNNWEVVMNDLAGGEPLRLTYHPNFDGLQSISPDGKKMLFARASGERFMSGLSTYVMDISSLNVGPEHYKGSIPPVAKPPKGWVPDPDLAAFKLRK